MSTTERDFAAMGKVGGVVSGQSRRAAILERADRTELVDSTVEALDGLDIGTNLLRSAVNLVKAAADGVIPAPESPLERKQLADAAKVIYMMARLQLGESTSNVATRSVEDARAERAALAARLAALQGDETQGTQPA